MDIADPQDTGTGAGTDTPSETPSLPETETLSKTAPPPGNIHELIRIAVADAQADAAREQAQADAALEEAARLYRQHQFRLRAMPAGEMAEDYGLTDPDLSLADAAKMILSGEGLPLSSEYAEKLVEEEFRPAALGGRHLTTPPTEKE